MSDLITGALLSRAAEQTRALDATRIPCSGGCGRWWYHERRVGRPHTICQECARREHARRCRDLRAKKREDNRE